MHTADQRFSSHEQPSGSQTPKRRLSFRVQNRYISSQQQSINSCILFLCLATRKMKLSFCAFSIVRRTRKIIFWMTLTDPAAAGNRDVTMISHPPAIAPSWRMSIRSISRSRFSKGLRYNTWMLCYRVPNNYNGTNWRETRFSSASPETSRVQEKYGEVIHSSATISKSPTLGHVKWGSGKFPHQMLSPQK